MNKCIKGESCLHCDTDYCRFKDEVAELKAEIFELKESLKCFQTPEAIKALTFYKTGEFELQEKKCIKLEQENERLKKQYNCYACDSCSGKEDYINMKRHTESAIKTVHKYSQALQEIREIVSKIIDSYIRPYGDFDQLKTILTKINEVIGAEE